MASEDTMIESAPDAPLPIQRVPLEQALFGAAVPTPDPPAARGQVAQRTIYRAASESSDAPVREGGPAFQVNLVQRVALTQSADQSATQEPGAESGDEEGEGGGVDLDQLAEEVYRRLRERLRVERERYGPPWNRRR